MRKKISKLIYIMSKKFEYPIERFIYSDDYTNKDVIILELDSNDLTEQEKIKEQENKQDEKKDDTLTEEITTNNNLEDLWDNKFDGVITNKTDEIKIETNKE